MTTPAYEEKQWLAVTRTGRVGLVAQVSVSPTKLQPRYRIQFGPDGPFHWFNESVLREATQEEIDRIEGVSS